MNGEGAASLEAQRAALSVEMHIFPLAVARKRESLFERHLYLNVSRASPLIAIASSTIGVDLSALAAEICPPRSWPSKPLSNDARATSTGIDRLFSFERGAIHRRHRGAGMIVKADKRTDDIIGIRVLGTSIELTVVDGALKLDTFHGFGRLQLLHELPATLTSALPGRPISALIDHPWLKYTNWPIVDAVDVRGVTVVIFETGQVPWHSRPAAAYEGVKESIGC